MLGLPRKRRWYALALVSCCVSAAFAADRVTLKNGFDIVCDHRAADGDRVRLYTDASGQNFVEVAAEDIVSEQHVDLLPKTPAAAPVTKPASAALTPVRLHAMLTHAGAEYDLDEDLLASVVRQESGGNARAVSRAGAQGLMQLMPKTAAHLGVSDSFAPDQNIEGGSAYLDALLHRYHDNLPLALAAYNAGPEAVDRWHGIPPYRETRSYVARVIHEYNRRYALRLRSSAQRQASLSAAPLAASAE
ncbi:lytic transglycosylase domain-containing protein [Acidipila sp. 4G-K13]|uniref:Lytic transglycosylase domain-containing protein n=2 Tax=Paracidobacterium acidisoli TaxID=2303751 RepID=A0A372IQT0_9BACT|nr:lytic transglycosylase domain-containing protein [Paracidobacterium acidisoli]